MKISRLLWTFRGLLVVLVFINLHVLVLAQETRIHLTSQISESFVPTKSEVTFEVTCWSLSMRPDRVQEAFEAGQLQVNPTHFRVISAQKYLAWTLEQWMPVSRMKWVFVLAPLRRGTLKAPLFSFSVNGTQFTTGHQKVYAFSDLPVRQHATQNVLPIWVHHRKHGEPIRIGSAFLIRENAVVTSFHTLVKVGEVEIRLPNGKMIKTRKAWAMDAKRDIVVLAVNPTEIKKAGLEPLALSPLADNESEVERVVFTAGWPRSKQVPSVGVWSAKTTNFQTEKRWISTNAVRPGDSGGPLLDEGGRVLGVVSLGDQDRYGQAHKQSMTISTDPRPVLEKIQWKEGAKRFSHFMNQAKSEDTPYQKLLEASDMLSLSTEQTGLVHQGTIAHYIRQMDDLAEEVGSDASAQFLSGAIYQLIGLKEKAISAYKTALDRNETQFMAAFALGTLALQQAQYTDALGYLYKVCQESPYERYALYGIAQSHIMRRELAAAGLALDALLNLDPNDPSVIFWKGIWYSMQKDELSARLMLAKLKSLNTEWADALQRSIENSGFIAPIPIKLGPLKVVH